MRDEYADRKQAAEMPQAGAMIGSAGRPNSKSMLLAHAERLRREAHQLEALAYQVEHINGDAEQMLYRLLAGISRT